MLATWGCTTFPKPTLSLDFLGATSLDSGITFSRGSQATLFDSTGTLVYAKQNLLLQSQALTTSPWITTSLSAVGSKIAPDGTATAIAITATGANGRTRQPVTVVAGQTYTHSMFVRRVTGSGNVTLAILDSGGTALFSTVLSLTSEWQRFTVSGAPAVTSILAGIIIATSTDAIEVWGAQLNQNPMEGGVTSSLTTYYPTTTAAYYAPRFDYNPSTLQPRGLLIEEQRTNSLTYSDDFANVVWGKDNGSVSSNTTAAPDGTTTADTFTENSANDIHRLNFGGTGIAAGAVTCSVFVKAGTGTRYPTVGIASGNSAYASATFNLATGTTTQTLSAGYSGVSGSIQNVGNGWFRCVLTATTTATANFYVALSDSSTFVNGFRGAQVYTGDNTSTLIFWGAQTEAGAFATSYIPTTTTALTRNADVASMTGTKFSSWYNASEGTLFAIGSVQRGFREIVGVSEGVGNDRIVIQTGSSSGQRIIVTTLGVQQALQSGSYTLGQTGKFAAAYATNSAIISVNGGISTEGTSVTVPTVTTLNIGNTSNSTGQISGYIQRIAYYPTRLPNATLQALTA